jgi:hypothetical protein
VFYYTSFFYFESIPIADRCFFIILFSFFIFRTAFGIFFPKI